MKRFLFCSFFFISMASMVTSYGQVEKGNKLLGGSGYVQLTDNFAFYLGPDIGCFVKDRLAVGGKLGFFVTDNENFSSFDFSLMPFVRYYIGETDTRLFGELGIGPESSSRTNKVFDPPQKSSDFYINGEAAIGIAHFLTNQVALEAALQFTDRDLFGDNMQGSLYLNFGFQIHLPGKPKPN